MYVDRDTRGKYSIMDLREGELMLIHEAKRIWGTLAYIMLAAYEISTNR